MKSYKGPFTITNYLKYLSFFFYVFLLTDTNLIGSVPNAGPISWNPDNENALPRILLAERKATRSSISNKDAVANVAGSKDESPASTGVCGSRKSSAFFRG